MVAGGWTIVVVVVVQSESTNGTYIHSSTVLNFGLFNWVGVNHE